MSLFNIPNYKRYWEKSEWDGVDFGIQKFMGRNRFNRFQAMFELPGGEGVQKATDPIFKNCLIFLDACEKIW
jgi:hypothetical protein